MSLQKQGITLFCEHCQFVSSDGCGAFDVTVPVRADGTAATARLRCQVVGGCHRVELVGWDLEQGCAESSEALRGQVAELLTVIADKRVCGNRRVCPVEVIRLVEEQAGA